MIQRLIENATQLFLLLALAPLVTGVIRTLKARLQTRRGPAFFSLTGICANSSARAW
jgi:formate hydrogenlyase subunit 4